MIGLNKIGLNQVQLNQLYLNTLCACQKSSGGDGFPRLPGDVTRWSFKGLTNEQMSKNPRLEDADHKGRFLTFKNFAWSGMSGVGGYKYNFLSNDWEVDGNQVSVSLSHKIVIISKRTSVQFIKFIQNELENTVNITLKITGLEANGSSFKIYDNVGSSHAQEYNKDGIYQINYTATEGANRIYFYAPGGNMGQLENPITIEQLPLYPGFILGDGVDDFAVTEKELNFEDTYTVYTAFIPFQEDPARNMVLCGKSNLKDFYMNYSSLNSINFYSSSKAAIVKLSNGFNLIICKRTTDKMIIKNLLTNVSKEIDANAVSENPGLYYLWRSLNNAVYANAAIAGQVICNGHFTTDEEDTKVLNWYKKEYPWLFFDQAWTVTGKSNEDTDRATIANITGNGNDLVLSNFGFAGNSGYGEYAYNWNVWDTDNGAATNVSKQYNKFAAVMPVNQSISTCSLYSPEVSIGTKFQFKLKITGLITNWIVRVMEGYTGDSNIIYEFDKDGTYQIDHTMTGSGNQLRLYIRMYCAVPNAEGTTVTVEQIPDHEGYLVTDGVDDYVRSSNDFTLGKKFTVVGEWELLDNTTVLSGIAKNVDFFLYSNINGLSFYCKQDNLPTVFNGIKSLTAFNSEGLAYDHKWEKYVCEKTGDEAPKTTRFIIGTNNNTFAKVAFKNMAMYAEKVLSKEDMIKAYIYLQTLKAK